MPFATAPDGVRIYLEAHGAGEPLLLLAGQACDHHEWDAVREDFVRHFRVVVFDYRGTGRSDAPQQPAYATRGFACDAITVLDHLGIQRAHAYGVSMGGRVAQWLGIDHPQRLGGLVLGATSPGSAHGVARTAAANAVLRSNQVAALLETSFTPAWIASQTSAVARITAQWQRILPAHVRLLHYQASEAHDSWDALPGITAPTLVIHGSDDAINPSANAPLIASRIPGATLHLLAGARHGYFEEFRETSSAAVVDFLKRHPLDPSQTRACAAG